MQRRWMRVTGAGLACASLLLSGCGDMKPKVWPFGGDTVQERPRTPQNATEYRCAAGKRFHVRNLEGGAVWLILPERELRLEKTGSDAAMRYSNGIAVLEIKGNEATLKDGAALVFSGCKTGNGENK